MAEVELPQGGWQYSYASIEPPRLRREAFRQLVPVRLALHQPSALLALVDSGSEHTLTPQWLAEELEIKFGPDNDRLLLGIGGPPVGTTPPTIDACGPRRSHQ